MNQTIHPLATEYARDLIDLFYDDIQEIWATRIDIAEFDLILFLTGFDVFAYDKRLTGDALVYAARGRAKRFYDRELRKDHHTPADQRYFLFWLEFCLLRTASATQAEVQSCVEYYMPQSEAYNPPSGWYAVIGFFFILVIGSLLKAYLFPH